MCGRLACSLCCDDIPKACGINNRSGKSIEPKWIDDSQYEYRPFYNGPPTTKIPVVISDTKRCTAKDENYFLVPMKWGYTPNFPLIPQVLAHSHNARIENIITSNMYKDSLTKNGRCIIVAEGFYEWQTTPGIGHKQPYFIYQDPEEHNSGTEEKTTKDKYLMKIAGLWTSTKTEKGLQYSCAVITVESDKSLSWMHHRMPIILNTQDEINDWLDHENVPYTKILSKIQKPFLDRTRDDFKLKYYTVDKTYVNKSTCDDPKCMVKVTVKRPNTLDNWLTSKKKK